MGRCWCPGYNCEPQTASICARLSDNAQEQKYLRETITGILGSATGMADFADKLKTAGLLIPIFSLDKL